MNDNTNSTEDIDICSICHENLTGDLYILPECSHKYHTADAKENEKCKGASKRKSENKMSNVRQK